MKLTLKDVTILPELSDYLPARSTEEMDELRTRILRAKRVRHPLIVWGPKHILIDGHGRIEIWEGLPKDAKVPPPLVEEVDEDLEDLDAVKDWMELQQLGQRNLDPTKASIIRGRRYNRLKKPVGNPAFSSGNSPFPQIEGIKNPSETAARVAAETGVSKATVERDGAYVDALDIIGLVNSKAKFDIENGTLKVSKRDVIALGKLPEADLARALKDIRMGFDWRAPKNGTPSAPAREPGDDTDAVEAEESRPKNGQVLYAVKGFEESFGKLMREIDLLGNAYRAKESAKAVALRGILANFHTAFKGWHKELAKAK